MTGPEGAWLGQLKAFAEDAGDAGGGCVLHETADGVLPAWEGGDEAELFDDRVVIVDHDLWRSRVEAGGSGLFAGVAQAKPLTVLLTQNRGEEYGVFERLVGGEARVGRRLFAD